jgi:hypothetical protein
MLEITEQRILQQMVEQATEIVPHGNHDFDAFRDGSRVLFNQVATSHLVQSQDGTQFSCHIVRRQTFVQMFQPVVFLTSETKCLILPLSLIESTLGWRRSVFSVVFVWRLSRALKYLLRLMPSFVLDGENLQSAIIFQHSLPYRQKE